MEYLVEIYDTWNRRVHRFDEVPYLESVRRAPDQPDRISGVLCGTDLDLSHGYRVRLTIHGVPACEARIVSVEPHWTDAHRRFLDRYVSLDAFTTFEAERRADAGDGMVSRAYVNRAVDAIVKDAIQRALGRVHYRVAHTEYPDGAAREYRKFAARRTLENELEPGGIGSGQWAGPERIDAEGAYAKDGDTIAGLVVDGVPWPDLRLMLIDSEETSRNSHAVKRHPETAAWTDARYDVSGYKRRADAAKAALQDLVDVHGIDYIELNPHQDASGAFDNRVDAYGRYIGLVYGGELCLNAAMIELGHADVYLYEDGRYLPPELELKDFFSYAAPASESIEPVPGYLHSLDVKASLFETLTALAYAARGYVWSLEMDGAVRFRPANAPDRVYYLEPGRTGAALGSDSAGLANVIYFAGNPIAGDLRKTYTRPAAVSEYGVSAARFQYFALSREEDADALVSGLLDDVAYPATAGRILFPYGDADIRAGDIVEIRGPLVRRMTRRVAGEWGDRYADRLTGRVKCVRHQIAGRRVSTTAELTSPLRSVEDPLHYIVRSQPGPTVLYQFRLDDSGVGLDLGYHLD